MSDITTRIEEIDEEILALRQERRELYEQATRSQDILLLKDNLQVLEDKIDELKGENDQKFVAKRGVEIHGKLSRYNDEVARLLNRPDNSPDEITLLTSLKPRLEAAARRLMIDVFKVDPEKV